ncbi:MAG: hypothetical protein IKV59_01415 [Lachnospiraceae bacterium]|nr:hypothetical protein [Lachnospiraceae bacterium]
MIKKKITALILSICVCFSLCGAGWFDQTKVVIDMENNVIYKYYTADDLILEFSNNFKAAKEQYNDAYILLSGKVENIEKNGKYISITGIECSCDKDLRSTALTYQKGNSIALFGQISIGTFDKKIRLKTEKIIRVPAGVKSKDTWFLLDGTSFDKVNAKKVLLDNGKVEYYIPPSWKTVEHDIKEEELGLLEGYQYVLNQVPGSSYSTPESLFVCYFDNKLHLSDYLNDSGETELIEKAIVKNILGNVGKFPSKEVKTYYSKEYTYYSGAFKNAFETGTGYHTEFLFQADGEEGIVMIVYVYKETKHISDILFLTRFLELKTE